MAAIGLTVSCATSRLPDGTVAGDNSGSSSKGAETGLRRFQVSQGSWLTIRGKASILDWQVRSSEVTGFMIVGAGFPEEPGAVSAARVEASLPVRSLKSMTPVGQHFSARFDGVIHQALQADTWPKASYCLKELVRAQPAGQNLPYVFDAKGELCLAGVTNLVSAPVQVTPAEGGRFRIVGSLQINMSAFRINPRLPIVVDPGPLKYEDEVRVSFEWLLQNSEPLGA